MPAVQHVNAIAKPWMNQLISAQKAFREDLECRTGRWYDSSKEKHLPARRQCFILCTLFSALVADQRATDTALVPRQDTLDFESSEWIWTATTVANEQHAFRKDFTPPLGKALIAVEIIVAAVNMGTFWVNGEVIGSDVHNYWATCFCVDLDPSFNVFAVNASSTGTDGVFIATILLTYSDGTTDTIVSDSTWHASSTVPTRFEQLSFDNTAWPAATVRAAYGNTVYGAPQIPANPPIVSSFNFARWIWTDMVPASGVVPISSRAFRRTWVPPASGIPASADIIITADNEYTLYVNGVEIGTGTNWKIAQHYTVNLGRASEILVAVLANNTAASTAGLLMVMEVNMAELPGFDDSTWPLVVNDLGGYPIATPWKAGVTIVALSAPVNAF
ncbi:hypothetical protein B0H13DRAFT_1926071 [Mycena leptocephala]|nr:hypothetical protein B0H13DRAFT_1926071 [Mycena leptocephala]